MATAKRFEDLEIWRESRKLALEIIKISKETELKKDFKLKAQIKSASGSIMDNIAEGFERNGNTEFRQFLSVAKGSAGEVRSQPYRIYDNEYIDKKTFEFLIEEYQKLSGKLNNFISYLNNQDFKGTKFR